MLRPCAFLLHYRTHEPYSNVTCTLTHCSLVNHQGKDRQSALEVVFCPMLLEALRQLAESSH